MAARAWRFESIYPKYEGLVRSTLRRYGVRPADLDDVTQEAFVTIHRKLGEFEERSSIETWLHAMCWRIAVAYRRRAHIRRETSLIGDRHDECQQPESERLLADRLHSSLGGLTEQQRDLLALHEIGGLSVSELAVITDVTRETVRDRLQRARDAMRRSIDLGDAGRGAARAREAPAAAAPRCSSAGDDAVDTFDYIDDGVAISSRGPQMFVLWRKQPQVRQLRIIADLMRRVIERFPGQITYLSIIEGTSGPPNGKGRQVNAEILAIVGSHLRGAAFITERKILADLLPPVMNTAAFFARGEFPLRYFSNLQRGAAYVAARCDVTIDELIAQMEAMRSQLDALSVPEG